MVYSTVEQDEVLTVDQEQVGLVTNGLKAARAKIRGRDILKIAQKVERDTYTVRAYLRGEVRDINTGIKILNYCNGFIALNRNCEEQKDKLVY